MARVRNVRWALEAFQSGKPVDLSALSRAEVEQFFDQVERYLDKQTTDTESLRRTAEKTLRDCEENMARIRKARLLVQKLRQQVMWEGR